MNADSFGPRALVHYPETEQGSSLRRSPASECAVLPQPAHLKRPRYTAFTLVAVLPPVAEVLFAQSPPPPGGGGVWTLLFQC